MKKTLLTLALVAAMASPAFASDDERIADLERRVAALEALVGTKPEGVSAVPDQEQIEPEAVETGIIDDGCSLSFKRAEVVQDYSGEDIVVLYFDFFNGSGKTTSAQMAFNITVFQHGREMDYAIAPDDEARGEYSRDFRSGADATEVAVARKIQDTTDIIVSLEPFISFGQNTVEFTVSLE